MANERRRVRICTGQTCGCGNCYCCKEHLKHLICVARLLNLNLTNAEDFECAVSLVKRIE